MTEPFDRERALAELRDCHRRIEHLEAALGYYASLSHWTFVTYLGAKPHYFPTDKLCLDHGERARQALKGDA